MFRIDCEASRVSMASRGSMVSVGVADLGVEDLPLAAELDPRHVRSEPARAPSHAREAWDWEPGSRTQAVGKGLMIPRGSQAPFRGKGEKRRVKLSPSDRLVGQPGQKLFFGGCILLGVC